MRKTFILACAVALMSLSIPATAGTITDRLKAYASLRKDGTITNQAVRDAIKTRNFPTQAMRDLVSDRCGCSQVGSFSSGRHGSGK